MSPHLLLVAIILFPFIYLNRVLLSNESMGEIYSLTYEL